MNNSVSYPILNNLEASRYRSLALELHRRAIGRELAWVGAESDFNELVDKTDRDLDRLQKACLSASGRGIDCVTASVNEMKTAISDIRRANPALEGDAFEAAAAPIVFESLQLLPIQPIVDPGFWRYVALVHLFDVVIWRHAEQGSKTFVPGGHPRNFGIGSSTDFDRCLPFRVFIRGSVSSRNVQKGGRPLAGLGDVDKWASHVLRQKYACHVEMVDAQFEGFRLMESHGASKKDQHLRQLPKRLAEVRSNVVLDILDLRECEALVIEEAEDLRTSMDQG